jgi:diguanylate cyclase (GGDEF)-like protein
VYFQRDGRVFFQSSFSSRTLEALPSLDMPLEAFLPLLSDEDYASVGDGFLATPQGPVLFAVTGITDDDGQRPPGGYLVIWRRANRAFFGELFGEQVEDVQRFEASMHDGLLDAVAGSASGVVARNGGNSVRWTIDDVHGEPLFVVRQAVPPRSFHDGPVSVSTAVGFGSLALLLLALAFLLSRYVIEPIVELGSFAASVAESEDFSRRPPVSRIEEIGNVAVRFDQLLGRVESQEKALKAQNSALEALSELDSLTSVGNRRAFERTLERDWARAMRARQPISCLMIDVDYFKSYNDHYGHPAGDVVLQRVAEVLSGTINRATDSLCRYGGEEFVALLVDTDLDAAASLAETMVRAVTDLAIPHAHSLCSDYVTICAGVATRVPRQSDLASALVRLADRALYDAKDAGRNRVVVSRDPGAELESS